ncbi:DUF2147 domain-containing protein [Sphingomonas cannabina]|uniref:DUF2147 domain-containing protein n=1 Tax=Sphingomonas cannabina TaxID=2899123 RepID=UPI001F17D999|nr:DUF2147 domain-containing protein [Sphingomonas cannabina]UIJ45895.1 DUF2147 domain-containing protein [Sphingomonas cannabina]
MTNINRAPGGLRSGMIAAVVSAVLLTAAPTPATARVEEGIGTLAGEWRNKKDTVHIRTHACGALVCGTVSWASAEAEADARRGGTPELVGTKIFREFRPEGDGSYKGKVFVPDMNRTFAGRLTVTSDDKLLGKGCVLGGLICKTSTWVRVR